MWAWTTLLGLVALVWLSRHIPLTRSERTDRPLASDSYEGPPADPPRVSVVVAAKDEEANIRGCIETLLNQDYPDFEVIAVDDRSSDRTGAILDELARRSDRLSVVHVTELREGWYGKNNAMREGIARATGEWLCLGDADCRQISERSLSMAVRHAVDGGIDFLSVLPIMRTPGFWERVLQPVCGAIMIFWFRPEKVNDPRSKTAYANGAFMLIRRDAYERMGGHEPVKTEVNEDMHLARICKQQGLRLAVVQNRDLYTVRMYQGFAQTFRGWSRIFYGCFKSFRRLLISLTTLTLISLSPWISLAIGLVGLLAGGGSGWTAVTVAAAAACVVQLTVMWRFYRVSQADRRYFITYPVGCVIAVGMLVNAMLKLGGLMRITWRGTRYRADRSTG